MRGADLKQRLQPLVDDALATGRCLGVLLLGCRNQSLPLSMLAALTLKLREDPRVMFHGYSGCLAIR